MALAVLVPYQLVSNCSNGFKNWGILRYLVLSEQEIPADWSDGKCTPDVHCLPMDGMVVDKDLTEKRQEYLMGIGGAMME